MKDYFDMEEIVDYKQYRILSFSYWRSTSKLANRLIGFAMEKI